MEFLQWLEQIPFSVWVREAPTAWAYPTVLLLHTAGMALCVGVAAGIDLRILGLAPSVRLSPLEKFFPVLWGGFFVNALTGTILVMQDATSKLLNVDFYVKMVFIALAVVTVRLIRKRVFTNPRVDDGPRPGRQHDRRGDLRAQAADNRSEIGVRGVDIDDRQQLATLAAIHARSRRKRNLGDLAKRHLRADGSDHRQFLIG